MPRIRYKNLEFTQYKLDVIANAVAIVNEWQAKGFDLTLRQVYYRFIALDLFPEDRRWKLVGSKWVRDAKGTKNAEPNYSFLGNVLVDARLAGVMDWNALVDRTREVDGNQHWDNPEHIIRVISEQYLIDTWRGQKYRVQVWVEKDAMEQMVGTFAKRLDIPFFSCRGYTSISALWGNAQVLTGLVKQGITPVVLHLGDMDPSGVDMTRNIEEQLRLFMGRAGKQLRFKRIALNMDQVEQHNPPPSPVKPGDSRSKGFVEEYGPDCWELDALTPDQLDEVITSEVEKYANKAKLAKMQAQQAEEKQLLVATSKNWKRIAAQLKAEMKGEQADDCQLPPSGIDNAQDGHVDEPTQAPPDDEPPAPLEYFADEPKKP